MAELKEEMRYLSGMVAKLWQTVAEHIPAASRDGLFRESAVTPITSAGLPLNSDHFVTKKQRDNTGKSNISGTNDPERDYNGNAVDPSEDDPMGFGGGLDGPPEGPADLAREALGAAGKLAVQTIGGALNPTPIGKVRANGTSQEDLGLGRAPAGTAPPTTAAASSGSQQQATGFTAASSGARQQASCG